jgi:glutaredoxin
MKNAPREVVIYSRPGCHLCDEAKEVIKRVSARIAITLHEVNIDNDPDARARFNEEIPVVFIDGKKAFKYRIEESELLRRLKSLPA